MALVGGSALLAQKRPLSVVDDDGSPAKKPRQSYHRHHSIQCKPQVIPASEPAITEQDALDRLLVGAIKSIVEDQGARRGVQDPVIESLALEALRNVIDECQLHQAGPQIPRSLS